MNPATSSKAIAEALNTLSLFVCPSGRRVLATQRAPAQLLAEAVVSLRRMPISAMQDPTRAVEALSVLESIAPAFAEEQGAGAVVAFFAALGMPVQEQGCPLHGLQCPGAS
ncbi:MAG: hypothetical protein JNM69_25705 [Archangium sp.]|nr:hypothetical protein [Archangium sp.]